MSEDESERKTHKRAAEVNAAVDGEELKDSLSWLLQQLWLRWLHLPLLLLLTSFRTHHH